jgi:hypothetical protein
MENSLVIIVLIAVLLILGGRYRQSRQKTRERRLRYNERGEPVAIEEVLPQKPVRLQGKGIHTSEPIHLEVGTYKVVYQFPDDVLVKVDLGAGGDSETILLKRGAGEASFAVELDGSFVFEIAPADDTAEWEMDITRLGLPSRGIVEPPDW